MNATSPATRLRVLTLNAWALPITVPGQDKRARTARLPEALQSMDADVIVLQEAFDAGVRRRVINILRDQTAYKGINMNQPAGQIIKLLDSLNPGRLRFSLQGLRPAGRFGLCQISF